MRSSFSSEEGGKKQKFFAAVRNRQNRDDDTADFLQLLADIKDEEIFFSQLIDEGTVSIYQSNDVWHIAMQNRILNLDNGMAFLVKDEVPLPLQLVGSERESFLQKITKAQRDLAKESLLLEQIEVALGGSEALTRRSGMIGADGEEEEKSEDNSGQHILLASDNLSTQLDDRTSTTSSQAGTGIEGKTTVKSSFAEALPSANEAVKGVVKSVFRVAARVYPIENTPSVDEEQSKAPSLLDSVKKFARERFKIKRSDASQGDNSEPVDISQVAVQMDDDEAYKKIHKEMDAFIDRVAGIGGVAGDKQKELDIVNIYRRFIEKYGVDGESFDANKLEKDNFKLVNELDKKTSFIGKKTSFIGKKTSFVGFVREKEYEEVSVKGSWRFVGFSGNNVPEIFRTMPSTTGAQSIAKSRDLTANEVTDFFSDSAPTTTKKAPSAKSPEVKSLQELYDQIKERDGSDSDRAVQNYYKTVLGESGSVKEPLQTHENTRWVLEELSTQSKPILYKQKKNRKGEWETEINSIKKVKIEGKEKILGVEGRVDTKKDKEIIEKGFKKIWTNKAVADYMSAAAKEYLKNPRYGDKDDDSSIDHEAWVARQAERAKKLTQLDPRKQALWKCIAELSGKELKSNFKLKPTFSEEKDRVVGFSWLDKNKMIRSINISGEDGELSIGIDDKNYKHNHREINQLKDEDFDEIITAIGIDKERYKKHLLPNTAVKEVVCTQLINSRSRANLSPKNKGQIEVFVEKDSILDADKIFNKAAEVAFDSIIISAKKSRIDDLEKVLQALTAFCKDHKTNSEISFSKWVDDKENELSRVDLGDDQLLKFSRKFQDLNKEAGLKYHGATEVGANIAKLNQPSITNSAGETILAKAIEMLREAIQKSDQNLLENADKRHKTHNSEVIRAGIISNSKSSGR